MSMSIPSLQQRAQKFAEQLGRGNDSRFVQVLYGLLMRGMDISAMAKAEYTKPKLRERLKNKIMAGTRGGKANQWTARKAQLLAAEYEKAGGGYKGRKSKKQRSLSTWSKQKWTTESGKPSSKTGEAYAPKKTIAALRSTAAGRKKLKEANRKKRKATREGKQYARHGLHEGKDRSGTKKGHKRNAALEEVLLVNAANFHTNIAEIAKSYSHVSKAVGAPSGYEPVPGSKHGGYRKKVGSGYDYWYPNQAAANKDQKHHEKQALKAKRMLALVMRLKKTTPEQIEAMMDKLESHEQHGEGAGAAHREKDKDGRVKPPKTTEMKETVTERGMFGLGPEKKVEPKKPKGKAKPKAKQTPKPTPKPERKSDSKLSKEIKDLGPIPNDFEDAAFTTAEVDSIREAVSRGMLTQEGSFLVPKEKKSSPKAKKSPPKAPAKPKAKPKPKPKPKPKAEPKTDEGKEEKKYTEPETAFIVSKFVDRGGYANNASNMRKPSVKHALKEGLVEVKGKKIVATDKGKRFLVDSTKPKESPAAEGFRTERERRERQAAKNHAEALLSLYDGEADRSDLSGGAIKTMVDQGVATVKDGKVKITSRGRLLARMTKGAGVDEKVWSEAKKLAKKQGQEKNYAYIMGIYKRLQGTDSVAGGTEKKVPKKNHRVQPLNKAMECPPATQDLEVNTKNRNYAIKAKHIQYGPLNIDEPGDYWKDIAKFWDTTEKAAKKSLCSNCVAFDTSPRMKECMPGEVSDDSGYLAYCWMHHFKCHSARSCYTWAKGGPITSNKVSEDWQERSNMKKSAVTDVKEILKGGPYIGPRGGKYADPQLTVHWDEKIHGKKGSSDAKSDDEKSIKLARDVAKKIADNVEPPADHLAALMDPDNFNFAKKQLGVKEKFTFRDYLSARAKDIKKLAENHVVRKELQQIKDAMSEGPLTKRTKLKMNRASYRIERKTGFRFVPMGDTMPKLKKSAIEEVRSILKGGPYLGPRGGKWADPDHKIAWDQDKHGSHNHDKRAPKPGTRITKKHKGEDHVIEVTEGGYRHHHPDGTKTDYNHKQLSRIASKIAGNSRNGYRFFKLKNEEAKKTAEKKKKDKPKSKKMTFQQVLDDRSPGGGREMYEAIEDTVQSLKNKPNDKTLRKVLDSQIKTLKKETGYEYEPGERLPPEPDVPGVTEAGRYTLIKNRVDTMNYRLQQAVDSLLSPERGSPDGKYKTTMHIRAVGRELDDLEEISPSAAKTYSDSLKKIVAYHPDGTKTVKEGMIANRVLQQRQETLLLDNQNNVRELMKQEPDRKFTEDEIDSMARRLAKEVDVPRTVRENPDFQRAFFYSRMVNTMFQNGMEESDERQGRNEGKKMDNAVRMEFQNDFFTSEGGPTASVTFDGDDTWYIKPMFPEREDHEPDWEEAYATPLQKKVESFLAKRFPEKEGYPKLDASIDEKGGIIVRIQKSNSVSSNSFSGMVKSVIKRAAL